MNELLIADNPADMAKAQHSLIASTKNKVAEAIQDATDAKLMRDQMRTAKMNDLPAARLHEKATERVCFLTKVQAALEAGYLMMPDMPGEVLAVRTDKETPKHCWRWSRSKPDMHPANPKLPVGVATYKSPRPSIEARFIEDPAHRDSHSEFKPVRLRNPDGIDHKFLKPQVIERTTGAMVKGIFDEIVCVGAKRHNAPTKTLKDPDPIVFGRVISKKQVACFLIAWFMDPTDL